MRLKNFLTLFLVALLSSGATVGMYAWIGLNRNVVVFEEARPTTNDQNLAQFTKKEGETLSRSSEVPFDFTEAAAKTTPSVVHIMAVQTVQSNRSQQMPDLFREFFGDEFNEEFFRRSPRGPQQAQSSGSGVIVSTDGYIVTNNHVVDSASEIEVILNNKQTYKAKVIGTDPSTDLAVLKIEAQDLPNIVLGNSDEVQVGQWVLAVGNPFNLESTVTAGIVSAKGRNLNLLRDRDQAPIEAFIQTDAAVNPGNSGGALINPNGELIGINTAIATPTGTYAGYSFAVPVNLVRKVMKDLIEYGQVQRGYLGVTIRQVDGKFAQEQGLEGISEGVFVNEVMPGSAADEAGIKSGDVIIGLDGRKIKSSPELLEEIAKRRPGNKVSLELLRNGKPQTIAVFLKGKSGNSDLAQGSNAELIRELGATFETLSPAQAKELGVAGGVVLKNLQRGTLSEQTNIQEGFVITHLSEEPVKNVDDLLTKLEKRRGKGGVLLEGRYPQSSRKHYYGFGW
ncbi:MAG: Do family serine endopeptidase [Microscillaceae bacterium]|nr:Do family serine endopeptidase [Microscillaceae bacterium]